MSAPPVVLTIAGSDPSGGAGIQQDLKVFEAFGVWGATAITAITVQDTRGVQGVHPVSWELVAAQIDAVAGDMRPAAVKIGMLATSACVRAVADALERAAIPAVVLDPVLAASDETALLDPGGLEVLRDRLVPLATIVTPNLAEAAALTGMAVTGPADQEKAARALVEMGAAAALVTGGHLTAEPADVMYDGTDVAVLSGRRVPGSGVHGTGCVLSSAIAAGLALGRTLPEAVAAAKEHVTAAIEAAVPVGGGASVARAGRPSSQA